jgi:hypothetical protein
MECPFLRCRDRGCHAGRTEIVFSEEYGYGEAQELAGRVVAQLGLTVTHHIDGPDAWIWDVQGAGGQFVVGYNDFPPETTLWAANPESDRIVERLFHGLLEGADDASAER